MTSSETRKRKRQQALERLRQNKEKSVQLSVQFAQKNEKADQVALLDFLEFSNSFGDLSLSSDNGLDALLNYEEGSQSPAPDLKQLQEQIKTVRREYRDENQEEVQDPLNSEPSKKRKELLQEALSNHFQDNIKEWLLVNPNLEISSTSLEELEDYKQEVLYRQKMLKVMLDATQHELSRLEQYIQNLESQRQNEL